MFLLKRNSVSVKMAFGIICCIGCTFGGVYFSYKGSKKGIKMAGAFLIFFAMAGFLGILSQNFNSYIICVPVPTCIFLGFFLVYKTVVKYGNKEQIKKIKELKTSAIIGTILYFTIQIGMIVAI